MFLYSPVKIYQVGIDIIESSIFETTLKATTPVPTKGSIQIPFACGINAYPGTSLVLIP